MLLCVHVTRVLFLVLAGNSALTMGFYWSYTSHPFLCALDPLYINFAIAPQRQFSDNFLLGQAWASLSEPGLAAGLHCTCVYVCLVQPLTVNCKIVHSNISQRLKCPLVTCRAGEQRCGNYAFTVAKGTLLPDNSMLLVSVKWPCDKASCGSQKLQISAMHELPARLLIHSWHSSACYIAHSLSVKLVPSSWSSWINSCLSACVLTYT